MKRLNAKQLRSLVESALHEGPSTAGLVMKVTQETFRRLGYSEHEAVVMAEGPPGDQLSELLDSFLTDFAPGSGWENDYGQGAGFFTGRR